MSTLSETPTSSETIVQVKDRIANPSPLGLLGFGVTTVLLNLCNVGLFPLNAMILAIGFAYGGLAQIIAGIMEFKKGNTFGATAFTSYGAFWWSLVLIWINPFSAEAPDGIALGCYMAMWCIFTLFMFIATLKHDVPSRIVFGTLTLLFLFLALTNFTGLAVLELVAGIIGIICGGSAIYAALSQVLKEN